MQGNKQSFAFKATFINSLSFAVEWRLSPGTGGLGCNPQILIFCPDGSIIMASMDGRSFNTRNLILAYSNLNRL